ncbi:peptide-methionine (S)-S-oxide reductase MsrA [bacterium]|nr:peptide-methionine (S)-S-oxide reductase MsrA [bacterium]
MLLKRISMALMGLMIGAGGAMAVEGTKKAVFAGGCFWCMEASFDHYGREGILSVTSGYTGGKVANPTYEQVGTDTTGHREAVEIVYDPKKVSYDKLLEVFWSNIDPTDEGGQFYDRGTHYKTAIFYMDEGQKKEAEASKEAVAKKLGKTVYTEILPAAVFYPAEDYHQDFYKKDPSHYNAYKKGSGREEKLKKIWGDR